MKCNKSILLLLLLWFVVGCVSQAAESTDTVVTPEAIRMEGWPEGLPFPQTRDEHVTITVTLKWKVGETQWGQTYYGYYVEAENGATGNIITDAEMSLDTQYTFACVLKGFNEGIMSFFETKYAPICSPVS